MYVKFYGGYRVKKILNIFLMSMPCIVIAMDKPEIKRHASDPLLIVRLSEVITYTSTSKSDGFIMSDQGCSPDHWHSYPELMNTKRLINKRRIRCFKKAMAEQNK